MQTAGERDTQAGRENETDVLDEQHIRTELVDRLWQVLFITALIGFPLSLTRLASTGWLPLYAVQCVMVAAIVPIYLLRRRISTGTKAWIAFLLPLILSVPALLNLGLQGAGMVWMVMSALIANVFFSRRLALLAVLIQILPLLLIAWGFVSGRLQLDFDANAFTREPAAWVGILVGLFTILMLVQLIGVYNSSIRRLLATVRAQRDVIARQALHDALTGLPSLQLARDRLAQAIVQAQRERRMAALLFIDLDDFKSANDRYGHDCGDAVLRTVATRLLATVRRTDTPARLGGDEFVVILNGIDSADAARHVAAQIVDSLAQPVIWQQHSLKVGASVGIALFPEHGDSAEALLRHADQAMYAVKRAGKASFAMYVPGCDKTVVDAS